MLLAVMEPRTANPEKDWAGSLGGYLVAWGILSAILIAARLLDPAPRAIISAGTVPSRA